MENNLTKALLALLQKGIVNFTYRKVDGSVRTAIGTRNLCLACKVLGVSIPMPKGKKENPTAYYDIEKGDWRSFKAENVLSINDIDIREIKGVSGGRIVKVSEPTEVEIPINFGGFSGGLPIGGTPKGEPTNFDLGKIKTALGMPNGTPIVKGEAGMGKPIGESVAIPFGDGKGMVFTPLAVDKDKIGTPVSSGKVGTPTFTNEGLELEMGSGVEDFAKLVAHYVVEEIIGRIK